MSTELEDRIHQWVDGAVAGVASVTVDEVLALIPSASSRSQPGDRRRRWLVPSVAAAVVVVAGALAFAVLSGDAEGPAVLTVSSSPEPEAGTGPDPTSVEGAAAERWETFVEPNFGWPWEQPVAWPSQSQRDYCGEGDRSGITSTLVTNTERRYSHPSMDPRELYESGCDAAARGWLLPDPLPRGFVGVEVVAPGDMGPVPPPRPDSAFPLDVGGFAEAPTDRVPGGTSRTMSVVVERWSYTVTLYEGSDVSVQDRAALARLIGSIEPTDLPLAEPITFGWMPEGARAHGGLTDPTVAPYASLDFPDENGTSDPDLSLQVRLDTAQLPLQLLRLDLDSPEPVSPPNVERDVPVERTRIKVRGVPAVLDHWAYGDARYVRVAFLDYDTLAVEVTAHGLSDDDVLRIVEELELVAVGGP
ncbi:MAG TPA: hypothetical protein PKE56_08410 [Acidimicrobiales bacterium]|nr:hypothetical protein [Acidimicrobiales bacterium]